MDEREIENRTLREHYIALKKRGTPDTDPRVKAIMRIMQRQKQGAPKEGRDFPPQIKFKPRRKQHGLG
jgi:hypothetical protein